MKGIVEERAVELGEYIIENKATVRKSSQKVWRQQKHGT